MNELVVFAKYWEAGKVKTRLARHIGAVASSQFYRASLVCTLQRFCQTVDRRVLAVTPPDCVAKFEEIANANWTVEPQAGGDLGARIKARFEQSFAAGAECVVLVGSDSPTMPMTCVTDAFRHLQHEDAVVGPTDDGGYYLIGLSRNIPSIFDEIEWSSPNVWRQTIDRLDQAGCRFAQLPKWYDVDTIEDLKRLRGELRSSSLSPELNRLSDAVELAFAEFVG